MLGCLVEKELTTPQQYPLTANALVLACSQTTNREPVMSLDEAAVQEALAELKDLRLVRFVLPSHGKSVTRYRHVLDEVHGLDAPRVALLAILLLRGPQTLGELRARTSRMARFDSLDTVQRELEVLADRPEPLARLLPRQPGQKEDRWQQLLASEPAGDSRAGHPMDQPGQDGPAAAPTSAVATPSTATGGDPTGLDDRVRLLMSDVAELREQVGELRSSLDALRRSLGG